MDAIVKHHAVAKVPHGRTRFSGAFVQPLLILRRSISRIWVRAIRVRQGSAEHNARKRQAIFLDVRHIYELARRSDSFAGGIAKGHSELISARLLHRHSDVVNQTITQGPLVYVVGQLNYVRASDLIQRHSVVAEGDRQYVEGALVNV